MHSPWDQPSYAKTKRKKAKKKRVVKKKVAHAQQ